MSNCTILRGQNITRVLWRCMDLPQLVYMCGQLMKSEWLQKSYYLAHSADNCNRIISLKTTMVLKAARSARNTLRWTNVILCLKGDSPAHNKGMQWWCLWTNNSNHNASFRVRWDNNHWDAPRIVPMEVLLNKTRSVSK